MNALKGIADVVLGWFGTSWNEVWTSIKTFFVDTWNSIASFFTGIVIGIRDFFVNTWKSRLRSSLFRTTPAPHLQRLSGYS